MSRNCCSRRCDGTEKCTVVLLCDRCNEPIDDEEEYYEIIGERLCYECWEQLVDDNFRKIASMEG